MTILTITAYITNASAIPIERKQALALFVRDAALNALFLLANARRATQPKQAQDPRDSAWRAIDERVRRASVQAS